MQWVNRLIEASMTTWIVAAGAEGRDYTEFFYRFGMAFVGGDSQRATMKKVSAGDTILLKRGTSVFLAAGTVVERNGRAVGDDDKEKEWLNDFDGWDLRGYCNVDWYKAHPPEPTTGLRIGTIYETTSPEHIAIAIKLLAGTPCPPQDEPTSTRKVSDDEILEFLVRKGLRVSAASELTEALRTNTTPGKVLLRSSPLVRHPGA
jgi:hypothetical protein